MAWKNWNIRRIVKSGSYLYAVVPEHPNKYLHDYVLLHRILIENKLKRLLTANEVVHHKNKNTFDNRLINLEVLSSLEHKRQHGYAQGKKLLKCKCPQCHCIFIRERRNSHLIKGGYASYCSHSCSAKFSRKIQLGNLTKKDRKALKNNVVCEFIQ